MSRTFDTKESYQQYFDELTDQIAQKSALWHDDKLSRARPQIGVMPFDILDLVGKAAAAGFLYDENGKQIWSAIADIDSAKNPTGICYLHCGDKTYRISNDPGSSPFVEENVEHPKLKQADTDLPKKFTTTEPTLKLPEFREQKPGKFWFGVDAVFRFFTGGRRGLPSVKKYNDALNLHNSYCDKLRSDFEAQKETRKTCRALQESLNEINIDRRTNRIEKLINAMRSYSISPNVRAERRETCAKLCNAFSAMYAGEQINVCDSELISNTCDRLAPYFLKNEKNGTVWDADPLLDGLKDYSLHQMRVILQNMNDKHVSAESAINILNSPKEDVLKQKVRKVLLKAPEKKPLPENDKQPQVLLHGDDQPVLNNLS